MKKMRIVLLALVFLCSLAACGKEPEVGIEAPISKKDVLEKKQEQSAETKSENPPEGSEESGKKEEPVLDSWEEKLKDTYWTAYELNDGFGVETLPSDYKWMDLILRADGTAQFREV